MNPGTTPPAATETRPPRRMRRRTARPAIRIAGRVLAYGWAAPCTAIGLVVGSAAMLLGARCRLVAGTLEFSGGRVGRAASRLPPPYRFGAITFGHTILAIDAPTLDAVRAHEQVHVRQYERWGPVFIPAYLLSSLFQLMRGRRPYRDNRFERQAHDADARARVAAGSACRRTTTDGTER